MSDIDVEVTEVDVVVVGAGLSGLSAAYELTKKDPGLHVVVLEAKDRIGGRTVLQELQGINGPEKFDLGGQWVGNCQPHIMKLLKELGLEVYKQFCEGTKVMQLADGKVRTYTSDIPSMNPVALLETHFMMQKIEKMVRSVPIEDPSLCPKAKEWDSRTVEDFKREYLWTKSAKDTVDAALRTIFGAEAQDMSLLYFLAYTAAAGGFEPLISAKENIGGQELRIKGGSGNISHVLADKIGHDKVILNSPIVKITQDDNGVDIQTMGGKAFRCNRAIITIPPHQAVKIEYEPPLPSEKYNVMQRMPVGSLTKVIVTYKTAFWRENGYSGEVVSSGGPSILEGCSTGPLCVAFDATSHSGSPAIVTFIGGQQQREYQKESEEDRKRAVLQALADYFGQKALDPLDYCEKDWTKEPYNGGCPVSMATPGVMTSIVPGLRTPFERLHFAGTESATVWCGFLNGAVQTGYRAAHEVLYNIRPQAVVASDLEDTHYGPKPTILKFRQRGVIRHKVVRWTVGLGMLCVLVVVAKKAYFRILI